MHLLHAATSVLPVWAALYADLHGATKFTFAHQFLHYSRSLNPLTIV